jgi:hypothetical protein
MIRLRLLGGASVVRAAAVPSGRSAYLHDREACLSGIVRSKGLGKSLRYAITKEMRLELLESLSAKSGNEPMTNETVR